MLSWIRMAMGLDIRWGPQLWTFYTLLSWVVWNTEDVYIFESHIWKIYILTKHLQSYPLWFTHSDSPYRFSWSTYLYEYFFSSDFSTFDRLIHKVWYHRPPQHIPKPTKTLLPLEDWRDQSHSHLAGTEFAYFYLQVWFHELSLFPLVLSSAKLELD